MTNIDFSRARSLEDSRRSEKAAEARQFLSMTDWYVIRYMETGNPIPEKILKLREEARKVADND